jgi:hypothetical protein
MNDYSEDGGDNHDDDGNGNVKQHTRVLPRPRRRQTKHIASETHGILETGRAQPLFRRRSTSTLLSVRLKVSRPLKVKGSDVGTLAPPVRARHARHLQDPWGGCVARDERGD